MKGNVTYNGYGFDECVVGRTAAYVDQVSDKAYIIYMKMQTTCNQHHAPTHALLSS